MENIYIIGAIALLVIILLFLKGTFSTQSRFNEKEKTDILYKFSELSLNLDKASESERRDKIVRADNLLAKVLQKYYVNSESLGQNLKTAKNLYQKSFYNEIWQAHKIRNEIVHNDKAATLDETKFVLYTFRKAIKEII